MGYFYNALFSFGHHPVSVYERKHDVRLNLFFCVPCDLPHTSLLSREKKSNFVKQGSCRQSKAAQGNQSSIFCFVT